jgi:hypothetical protein
MQTVDSVLSALNPIRLRTKLYHLVELLLRSGFKSRRGDRLSSQICLQVLSAAALMQRNDLKLRRNRFVPSFYHFANSLSTYPATWLKPYSYDLYSGTATVRGSNSGGGKIFRTRRDQPWGLPSPRTLAAGFLYRGGGGIGRGVALTTHPPLGRSLKKELAVYLYSPFGHSWPVLMWTSPLPLLLRILDEDTVYPDEEMRVCSFPPRNHGTVLPIGRRLVPLTCFSIHYLFITLPFNAVRSALLTVLQYMVYLKCLDKLQELSRPK